MILSLTEFSKTDPVHKLESAGDKKATSTKNDKQTCIRILKIIIL